MQELGREELPYALNLTVIVIGDLFLECWATYEMATLSAV